MSDHSSSSKTAPESATTPAQPNTTTNPILRVAPNEGQGKKYCPPQCFACPSGCGLGPDYCYYSRTY